MREIFFASWVLLISLVLAIPTVRAADSQIMVNYRSNLKLGAYSDVDKLNDGSGGWINNWFNDINEDGKHNPGEPFSDHETAGWVKKADGSCWIASGCNLLQQAGLISDAQSLYNDYALNGIDYQDKTLTWDEGGLQEYVIDYWVQQNPQAGESVIMNTHWGTDYIFTANGLYAWEGISPRDTAENYLRNGWEVGIGMWPLTVNENEEFVHYVGHALTIQDIHSDSFECTDSDSDEDFTSSGDLNTYNDVSMFNGDNYYLWYNDYYDGRLDYYPAGDVGYICAVIPEPSTIMLMAGGVIFLRRNSNKSGGVNWK